jgi:large subunit ribosomal protein L3
MKTVYGIKANMTQTWDASGKRVAVTVVKTPAMVVTAVKNLERDGYHAVQVGLGQKPARLINQPLKKQLQPAIKNDSYPRYLKEIRLDSAPEGLEIGQELAVDASLTVGDIVHVSGVSRGHGFEGVMKRWGFSGGPRTHGQSDRARAPGSIGQGTSPGRVHKGKKMAGHYGSQRTQLKNLIVVKVDTENGEVWLSGPIPGAKGTLVEINVNGKSKFPGLRQTAAPAETETAG